MTGETATGGTSAGETIAPETIAPETSAPETSTTETSTTETSTTEDATSDRTDDAPAGVAAKFADRSWWRRPRPLRRKITVALIVTALLAVGVFGAINFFAARNLLVEGTEDQLGSVAATRANSIEGGADELLGRVSATSADLGIVRALEDFTAAYVALEDEELTDSQLAELDAFYEEVVSLLEAAGLGAVPIDDVIPASNAGKYLQYHYRVPVGPGGEAPIDPGDGSRYTDVNVANAEYLQTLADTIGGGDLLLISTLNDGEIVYSVDKQIDIGANLADGPYADNNLARAIIDQLPRTQTGSAVMTDFQVYIPAGGEPVLFAVSAVRSGTELIGALAVEVPVTGLNALTTAGGDWEAVGLGDGESYIVAADGLLQSESRLWIEDPEEYLERLREGDEAAQERADLIEAFGSPVGIQVVDTEPVRKALEGEVFSGTTENYLGEATYASAQAISVPGTQWVVVSEVPQSAATEPLFDYLARIVIVMVILVPLAAFIGIALARRLTRPIGPTVDAAEAIAAGERNPDLDEDRRDEFGDLARRLNTMATDLGQQETELLDEFERRRALLLAVLPPHLVGEDGAIASDAGVVDEGTMISIGIDARDVELGASDEATAALHTAAANAERIAEELGVQRVRVAADRYLFVAGIGATDDGAEVAIEFVTRFEESLAAAVADADIEFDLHIGLSTGGVATGVLERGSLTFGAWGDPVRRALAISALSRTDQVLLDASTAGRLTDGRWILEPASDIVDLDDEPMELFVLAGSAVVDAIGGTAAADSSS